MITVAADPAVVESALDDGALHCPACEGVLRRWGYGSWRRIRERDSERRWRPHRSICAGCGGTHVLLAATLLARRADEVEVIGQALTESAAGAGYRVVAAGCGRPAETVRG
ncbi:MAG: hypothetical protein ACYDB7_00780 [Mycobacteriales bacterium]